MNECGLVRSERSVKVRRLELVSRHVGQARAFSGRNDI
jgi:hypothetical protein